MNTYTKYLLLSCFLLLLFAVPVISFLHTDKKIDAAENRVLQTIPSFQEHSYKEFFDKMSLYFNDHFGWRKNFIKLHNATKELFGQNPHGKRVVIGKDDFTFYYESINMVEGKRSDKIIDLFIKGVEDFKKELPDTPVFILIAPSKSFVYSQNLPDYVKQSDLRKRIVEKFKAISNVHTLDLLDAIKAENKETYMRYETHWNGVGAYAAYIDTVNFINKHTGFSLQLKNDIKEIKERKYSGDLATMMGKAGKLHDTNNVVTFKTTSAKKEPKAYTYPKAHIPDYKNAKGKMKALILHDSFMEAYLGSYLSQTFNEMINIWDHGLEKGLEIARKEKPDLIVIEVVDRHIY